MKIDANSPEEYITKLPDDRKAVIEQLRAVINENLPEGFQEEMNYGMIGWVVPHSIFPAGYHCDPKLPLPFMSIASQKHFVALYHSGIYAIPEIHDWFVQEYPKYCKTKLDMGKSCVRLKKMDQVPYALVGELCRKITVQEWIECYQSSMQR